MALLSTLPGGLLGRRPATLIAGLVNWSEDAVQVVLHAYSSGVHDTTCRSDSNLSAPVRPVSRNAVRETTISQSPVEYRLLSA